MKWDSPEAVGLWGIDKHSPYEGMLLDFIEEQAQKLRAGHPEISSKEEWLDRSQSVRSRLLHSLGLADLPPQTPLHARVAGRIERPNYSIEKVIYEARPGFPVPAHLYLPKAADFPAPTILYSPGHWMENSKLEPDIQNCCANLCSLGFVVLVYDPIGQGERLGNWLDHGHLEPLLVGLSQEGLMVWESMRAIDYLLTRPEVDPQRIGMTGASGGGLNTFYTAAVDDRIQVSVPVCYVNTFFRMMRAERDRNWEDGVDLCNQVPYVISYAEMSDICGLFAPKPQCLIAGIHDWMFPIQGVREIYSQLQRIYELLRAGDRLHLAEIDAEHGYTQKMREAAYGWFARWLNNAGDGAPIPEREVELMSVPFHPALTYIEPPDKADLPLLRQRAEVKAASEGLCFQGPSPTPVGQAITALARERAQPLPPDYGLPVDTNDWRDGRENLAGRVQQVIGPFPKRTPLRDRIFKQVLVDDLFAERIVFESEEGVEVPAMFLVPARWDEYLPVVVYIDEWGKGSGLSNGMIETLVSAGYGVLAIDIRGVGESAATDFEAATNALMTARPLFGQRVWDVLRAVDYLWHRIFISVQIDKGRIGCLGQGAGGMLALYAAAMDERIAAAVIQGAPVSYKALIVERPSFPASAFLFDVLKHFDLVHVAGLVAPRPLFLGSLADGRRQAVSQGEVEETYRWCRDLYKRLGAPEGSFTCMAGEGSIPQSIEWLRHNL